MSVIIERDGVVTPSLVWWVIPADGGSMVETRTENGARLKIAQVANLGDARLIAAAPTMFATLELIKHLVLSSENLTPREIEIINLIRQNITLVIEGGK